MQHDSVRFHQTGKKTRRQRYYSRRNDDRPNVVQRQSPLRLPIHATCNKTSFTTQNRPVLENMENVMAHTAFVRPASTQAPSGATTRKLSASVNSAMKLAVR